jgi:hypothetical protein
MTRLQAKRSLPQISTDCNNFGGDFKKDRGSAILSNNESLVRY